MLAINCLLLYGRVVWLGSLPLRSAGLPLPPNAFRFAPLIPLHYQPVRKGALNSWMCWARARPNLVGGLGEFLEAQVRLPLRLRSLPG
jgi:hypothetical protein